MCVSDRLRELRENCPPLQPYAPVRLWNRSLSPNLRLRGGRTQDGGEEKTLLGSVWCHFEPSTAQSQHFLVTLPKTAHSPFVPRVVG